MQIRFQLSLFANRFFIIIYVTLIMAQDAPKRRFLSLIFLVSCISKSLLIFIFSFLYTISAFDCRCGCIFVPFTRGEEGNRARAKPGGPAQRKDFLFPCLRGLHVSSACTMRTCHTGYSIASNCESRVNTQYPCACAGQQEKRKLTAKLTDRDIV